MCTLKILLVVISGCHLDCNLGSFEEMKSLIWGDMKKILQNVGQKKYPKNAQLRSHFAQVHQRVQNRYCTHISSRRVENHCDFTSIQRQLMWEPVLCQYIDIPILASHQAWRELQKRLSFFCLFKRD